MDLLGRKAKKQYEAEFAWSNNLVNKLLTAIEQRDEVLRLAEQLSTHLFSRSSLVNDLIVEVETLKRQLEEAQRPLVVQEPRTRPAHMSEEEQELQFQLDNRLIDKKEYETLLEELDFQNASIDLDPDYSTRPDLTY